jgi:hypothetical protein
MKVLSYLLDLFYNLSRFILLLLLSSILRQSLMGFHGMESRAIL